MSLPRGLLFLFSALILSFSAAFAPAQDYTSIVVFGDSLSDVGNVAHLAEAKYSIASRIPGPIADYTDGRFTDGTDTVPAAHNFNSVWIEQLAAMLPSKPAIKASLDGGTDYAYGSATTANGTTTLTFGTGGLLSININNIGQQITDYLATTPTITNKTLFVVWGGADNVLQATSPADITTAINQEIANIQRLISAGATDILIPNLPPMGAIPRLNGSSSTSTPATQASDTFNKGVATGIAGLPGANPGKTLHFYQLDVFSLFNNVIASPSNYSLTNVTGSSQGNPTINPDTYLFWDDLHPTTRGHNILAVAAASVVAPAVTTTTTVTSSALKSNLDSPITFTATVVAASGSPTGTVTFLDGSTALGTGTLNSGGTPTATATFSTSSLTAGTHSITAAYAGATGFMASTSAAITQTITAPALASALSPTSITIARGATGSSTLTLTPTGGYSGSATFACGTLPAHLSCTFAPASLSFTGSSAAQSSTLTVGTTASTSTALLAPARPGSHPAPLIFSAFAIFPLIGFGGLAAFRRRSRHPSLRLLVLLAMLSAGAALGLTGCGGNDNKAARGTYTVPINVTANGSTSTLNLTVIVQ